jgi:hypothetical protein
LAKVVSRGGRNFGDQYSRIFKQGRDAQTQAGYQLAGVALSLGLAIFSGVLTGYITSRSWFEPPPAEALFDDRYHWDKCVIEHEELHVLKDDIQNRMQQSKVSNMEEEEEGERLSSRQ